MIEPIKLYPHQERALKATENLNRVAYYHDMGLGKTFTGSEKMMRLGAKVNLLICQKSKIPDWIEHFKNHYMVRVLDLRNTKQLDEFHGLAAGERFTVVGIINYELAWRRKPLLDVEGFTLMLDESSLIQNRKAKQTKFILKLKPANVILLSGTPTAGKYENLWSQLHLLGWPISEQLYNRQYVNWDTLWIGGMPIKTVDKKDPYKNIERLKEKMREYGADFLKTEECFELPTQTFIPIMCETSKDYKKFMRNGIIQMDDHELVGNTTLVKHLISRQLCGNYSASKLTAFRDLLESTNDRVIVFYNFNTELLELTQIAKDLNRPVSIINGEHKILNAYRKESNSVTLIQYQAGAMGLNLQLANKIVYFTPPERCELWMQSQKRIHRIGQGRPCYYYKLICKGSVEESIYNALDRGVDYTDELFRKDEENEQRRKRPGRKRRISTCAG